MILGREADGGESNRVIKAITLWQPWASLIAHGLKTIETRSWYTKYRGPLAIHAAKRKSVIPNWPIDLLGAVAERIGAWNTLPRGCIVALCNLDDCVRSENIHIYRPSSFHLEENFGNFTSGRFCWLLSNIRRITPVYMNGRQGLWNWYEQGETVLRILKGNQ